MRMNRVFALLTALILCLSAVSLARAEADYPPFQGIVSDTAEVLSDSTRADLRTLSDRLEDACGGHLYVLTRHFLGGANAQQYAQQVFATWNLGDTDVLLLLVIGEKSCALATGSFYQSVPDVADMLNNKNAAGYINQFRNRAHDEAVAGLAVALGQRMARAVDEELNVYGLFGKAAPSATAQPQSWSDMYSMFAQGEYEDDSRYEPDVGSGFNWRGLLIWGLVIYFLFFRRKKRLRR